VRCLREVQGAGRGGVMICGDHGLWSSEDR
jgi:hypothetical protein